RSEEGSQEVLVVGYGRTHHGSESRGNLVIRLILPIGALKVLRLGPILVHHPSGLAHGLTAI
ncbi:hypothetical protein DRO32_04620, partial [Candidatus Bathyarchaeota archaeon]